MPEPSVSPGPSESGGPSGLTAPTDPQPQVFLSYQWDIKAKVIELKEKLKLNGLSCWMDEDAMDPGDELRGEIEHGISHCKVLTTFSKVLEGKKIVNWSTCPSLSRTKVSEI